MHLVLIFVIILAFFPYESEFSVAAPMWRTVEAGLGVLFVWAVAEIIARVLVGLLQRRPERRSRIIRAYGWCRLLHTFLLVGTYFLTLYYVGWSDVIRKNAGLQKAILIDEILLLTPFLISLVLEWAAFYRVERALRETRSSASNDSFWSRGEYIWFHAQHYLGIIFAPILLFTAIHELLLWPMPWLEHEPWFQVGVFGFMVLTLIGLMPWLLTVIWQAKSLPAGPLRDRLEAAARRLRFRYTDILLWNTRGNMANALVTGILPTPRYVLLSDSLVRDLRPEEVEAVFGHEVGHVKHSHMLLYLGFLATGMFIACLLTPPLELADVDWAALLLFGVPAWGSSLWMAMVFLGAFLGGYVFLVFGFLSRRCERQADIFGCKAVSCHSPECPGHDAGEAPEFTGRLCPTGIRTFIQALEKVADLNGIRRDRPSWMHWSIARRVSFLERMLADTAVERRFQRRLLWTKGLLFLTLWAILGGVAWYQFHSEIAAFVSRML